MSKPCVGIVMGSDSDFPVIEKALDVLDSLSIAYEITITSAHRTPEKTEDFAKNAEQRGIEVIIACAGMAAHLAGVIASYTTLPVIGVPISSSSLNGLDALLSTVQMPGGVPVATMAIGEPGAVNAAHFAARVLGLKYPEVKEKLVESRKIMAQGVVSKAEALKGRMAARVAPSR